MAAILYKALTIAGSDSGGGAGIQADLKTFMALGVYGVSVVTAVTAQNTVGVHGVVELAPDFVALQMDAVLSDIGAHSAKTGMLSSPALVGVVSRKIKEHRVARLVVDPVMVAKGGHALLSEEARRTLVEELLPLAEVVTPNLYEAAVLAGMEVRKRSDMEEASRRIKALGPAYVLVKGGHLEDEATDLLFDGSSFEVYSAARIETTCTHGAGCTFSAAVAAGLARGESVREAALSAKRFVTRAISEGLRPGRGHGTLNHRILA